jgi:hypothetical protein
VEVMTAFSEANDGRRYRGEMFDEPDEWTVRITLVGKPNDYDLQNVRPLGGKHFCAP